MTPLSHSVAVPAPLKGSLLEAGEAALEAAHAAHALELLAHAGALQLLHHLTPFWLPPAGELSICLLFGKGVP